MKYIIYTCIILKAKVKNEREREKKETCNSDGL